MLLDGGRRLLAQLVEHILTDNQTLIHAAAQLVVGLRQVIVPAAGRLDQAQRIDRLHRGLVVLEVDVHHVGQIDDHAVLRPDLRAARDVLPVVGDDVRQVFGRNEQVQVGLSVVAGRAVLEFKGRAGLAGELLPGPAVVVVLHADRGKLVAVVGSPNPQLLGILGRGLGRGGQAGGYQQRRQQQAQQVSLLHGFFSLLVRRVQAAALAIILHGICALGKPQFLRSCVNLRFSAGFHARNFCDSRQLLRFGRAGVDNAAFFR